MASSLKNAHEAERPALPEEVTPGAVADATLRYLTPTVMVAELLAGLLSVPLKAAWPVVDMVPVALKVTLTVTTTV